MGEQTAIAWTDRTFNGWVGCERVSPGCQHCYAEQMDKRVGGYGGRRDVEGRPVLNWGKHAPRYRTSESTRRLVADGKLARVPDTERVLIPRIDLDRWLAGRPREIVS